jgi:Arc/MetJ-type ribon-helix-helix transcriptional regulator
MSKAENFTVRMGEDLKQRMQNHPEINWSHVIREHVHSMLDDIERMNELTANSQLTDDEIDDLAEMINAAAAERAQADLETETSERTNSIDEDAAQRRDRTNLDVN